MTTATKLQNKVFLGGTCGHNRWREEIVIPGLLARGVAIGQIFNPVVAHWDKSAQAREDEAKRSMRYQLYVIASPYPGDESAAAAVSGYSLVEATMGLYDAPERTLILVDTAGMADHTAKAIAKSAADWHHRFPDAPIFADYASLIEWLAAQLRGE